MACLAFVKIAWLLLSAAAAAAALVPFHLESVSLTSKESAKKSIHSMSGPEK